MVQSKHNAQKGLSSGTAADKTPPDSRIARCDHFENECDGFS